ncbi:MAG: hypothetical protein EOM59_06255 [Clostridia bacterium]|nr:hypothetical protein [Clostridia bacterium]
MFLVSFLLFLVCIAALFIGLLKPDLVIRWGDQTKKTRKSVLKYYGIGLLLFFALSTAFAGNTESDSKDISNTSNTAQEEPAAVDKSAALAVDSQIEALGDIESLTLDKSAEVQAVRASYESLDAEQKGYVANIAILTSAEAKIVDLQAAADEQAAAQAEAERVAEAVRAASEAQEKAELEAAQAQNSYTVYITETGDKYHRDGCQYLRKSQIAITKSDAINSGYTPCSRCNP